jgi:hypothetical protein
LDSKLRQSIPARTTAVGFIVVIICGNFWLVAAMLGRPAAAWVANGFLAGTAVALAGGAGLLVLTVYRLLFAAPEEPGHDALPASQGPADDDESEAVPRS